jgi:DNA-binding IclR family transcriptional regulator
MASAQISLATNASVEGTHMAATVVKSAGRALQILEFFDEVQREVSVTEVSRALRYPQSSTSVLLHSLVSMGYLQHDRYARTYYPTRRVSLLGSWVDPALVRHGTLIETIKELSRKTKRTVSIATDHGLQAQYIYVQRPDDGAAEGDAANIGSLRCIGRTAAGLALLSNNPDAHVERLLRRINAEREVDEAAIDIPAVLAKLSTGRRRGFFSGPGARPGDLGIACLHDGDRQFLAISIEGPAETMAHREEAYRAMLTAAMPVHQLSRLAIAT